MSLPELPTPKGLPPIQSLSLMKPYKQKKLTLTKVLKDKISNFGKAGAFKKVK